VTTKPKLEGKAHRDIRGEWGTQKAPMSAGTIGKWDREPEPFVPVSGDLPQRASLPARNPETLLEAGRPNYDAILKPVASKKATKTALRAVESMMRRS
jgi:hypothetical protein